MLTHSSTISAGWGNRLDFQFMSKDLAQGNNIVFAAMGITSSGLLKGVEVMGTTAITHSVLMRARSETVRLEEAHHNLERKTLRLRSTAAERKL
jgi:fructose-1,6-bisphosphatase II